MDFTSLVGKRPFGKKEAASGWLYFSKRICATDWSPALFKNNYRCLENFESLSLMVWDVDGGMSLDQAKELFKDYKHIIATSRNHQKEKQLKTKTLPACDRFRVILELSAPITDPLDYKATFFKYADRWPGVDRQCNDASRMFYKCSKVVSIKDTGAFVHPEKYAAPERKAQPLRDSEIKGFLAKNTTAFLLEGAPDGAWNSSLYKAAKDAQQQGYSEEWFTEKVERMAPEPLDESDLGTIESAFKGAPTHPARLPESPLTVRSEEMATATLAWLEKPIAERGTPTGWPEWDEVIGGFRLSELAVLQAIPKTGKNTLINNIIHNLCKQGNRCAFASLEMSPVKQVEPDRWSLILERNVLETAPTASEFAQIQGQLKGGFDISYFKREHRPTASEIVKWIEDEARLGVQYFFIDHFHKFCGNSESVREVEATIMALSDVKERLGIFIMLVIQPTKLGPDRYGNLQRVSSRSLRGGAALFDEPDLLINLHRIYWTVEEREKLNGDTYTLPVVKQYEKSVREVEFEAIRARPFSDNAGLKVHMRYDSATTRMQPATWIDPNKKPDPAEARSGNNGAGKSKRII